MRAVLASRSALIRTSVCLCAFGVPSVQAAKEDIEFVQEHLPEVAMDNRYATLPMWSGVVSVEDPTSYELQSALSDTQAGNLTISGPLFSIGVRQRVSERWSLGALAFYDALDLRATEEIRDLQTLFAPSTPIMRPIPARFTGLDGSATDLGFGLYASRNLDGGWLGKHEWLGGVLWQKVALDAYEFHYEVLSGPQTGLEGTIDFDASYSHWVPFVGIALPRDHGDWTTSLHVLVALPLPRRGIAGHITGPGFDIRGNTADVGEGKHFGDPSMTIGYAITYRPAHLSIDLGALATQALLEPYVHRGIESNILLSFTVAL